VSLNEALAEKERTLFREGRMRRRRHIITREEEKCSNDSGHKMTDEPFFLSPHRILVLFLLPLQL